jgi:electron transfer flavoprotein beta subunit
MNILVCISKVPDTTTKIRFLSDASGLDTNGVTWIVNPSDEWYALVRALELKEAAGSGKVTIITVGGAEDDPIIRKALAVGADEAVRIDVPAHDAAFVAKQIAAWVKENPVDFILTGKETIDYNGSVMGGMLAAHLDVPYVALVEKLEKSGNTTHMHRDIGGGTEEVEVEGMFVASATKGLAEQRIPNMRGIMAARTKPIHVTTPVDAQPGVKFKNYSLPPEKGACKMIDPDNMDELVRLLNQEAKVL